MPPIKAELRGIIYIILSGFFYGFLGYFGYYALQASPDVANMLFWRFLIASVFIALVMLPKIKTMKFDLPLIAMILLLSGIFYGSSTFAYFSATSHIGTGIAMVIFFTYPAMVILCNRFVYKSKISRGYYISLILIFVGLLLLVDLDGGFSYKGVTLSLVAAAGYAFYIITSKRNGGLHPLLATFVVCVGCCIFTLMHALAYQKFSVPSDPIFWINSVGLGIISTALPVLLLLEGLKYASSEKAAILGVLEPIFVALSGIFLLGETVGWLQAIGMAVILSGALLSLRNQKQ